MRRALSYPAVAAVLLACALGVPAGAQNDAGAKLRPLDPLLTSYDYPFPVKFFEVDTQRQKLRMAYMDVPAATPNGRTVVLMHGKNFSGAYWKTTIEALVAAGFRVVVPDQIGFGKSAKPERYQFTFHALAANTVALLDSLGVEKFSLVGHSMGGMLATRTALMHPNRVEKLALVNPIGLEDWKVVVPYTTVEENYAQELKKTPEGIKEYMRQSYFGGEWKPEYDFLVEILAGWTLHPEHERVAWNAALTTDMVFTQPVVYEFEQVKTPTLLIVGLRDRTAIGKDRVPKEVAKRLGDYPALGKAAAKRIPDARLVEIEEAGHMPQVETFERYRRALVEFL